MPLFDYKCGNGHVFEAFVQPQQERLKCRTPGCKRKAERIYTFRSTAGRNAPHVYTGKKIWIGSEIYGSRKKAQSDEVRADLEASMIKDPAPLGAFG